MFYRPDIYVPLIYITAAFPFALLGLYAWRKRPAVAVNPFAWAVLCMSIWSFTYGLEIFFPTLPAKLMVLNFEYLGIVGVSVFMLFFALEFTGKSHLLTKKTTLLLWGLPLIILLLVWTNPLHQLMWSQETVVETAGIKLLHLHLGPFFWVHVIYSYGLLALASLLLVMELFQRSGIYRVQVSFVIAGILFPMAGSLMFVAGIGPIKDIDLTPLCFLPAAFSFAWAIVKHRLMEVMPPEHINVLRNMKDGVVVLNPQQRVLYINPTAEELFQRTEDDMIGQPLSQISETFAATAAPFLNGTEHQTEYSTERNGAIEIFELTISPVTLQKNKKSLDHPDMMITLHDITHRKEAEAALSRRESIMSAISMAAEQFLKESQWEHNIPGVLENIGQAADVSRVHVVMNYLDNSHTILSSLCYEWTATGIDSQLKNPLLQHINLRKEGFARWENNLSQGLPVQGLVRDFPKEEQRFLRTLGSISMAVVPIFVDFGWWGFLVFDECHRERQWSGMELDAFHVAASIFGAAEARARTEQKARQKQNSLNLLNDIVRESLTAQSLQEMAQKTVDRLAELIHADGCFITLWDETKKKTLPLAAYGPHRETYLSVQIPIEKKTFTESALALGKMLIIEDAYNSPYVDPEVSRNFSSRSGVVFPLIAGEKKLGALIFSFDKLHKFQSEEIATCEQAASLIALAFEKFQAMEEATQRAATSEILRKASVTITEKLELEHTVSHILEQLHQVIPYDSASVQLLEGDKLKIIGGRGWNDLNKIIGLTFPVPGDNPNSVVIETGAPYHLSDTWEVYTAFREPPHNHIRSWLGVPLIVQNKIIGLLAIDSAEPDDFSDADINIASEFANQVASALENARLFSHAQTQAITDVLTGIYNRRGLYQLGEFEFERARRIQRPFCALMFDIDHFKRVNDTHGHAVGDQVLRLLAERCHRNSRAIDLIGRYGGEEFIVLLPETNLESAHMIAKRLRKTIIKTPFKTDAGELPITVSIGVAEADLSDTFSTLIEKADKSLYQAKHSGRDCIVVYQAAQELDQT
jgi:diguanylate cyclase (GGDEF)-like protein/PAS domain S-box-containing protein